MTEIVKMVEGGMKSLLIAIGFLLLSLNASTLRAEGNEPRSYHHHYYDQQKRRTFLPPSIEKKVPQMNRYSPSDLKYHHHTWPYSSSYLFYLKMGQSGSFY